MNPFAIKELISFFIFSSAVYILNIDANKHRTHNDYEQIGYN